MVATLKIAEKFELKLLKVDGRFAQNCRKIS